MSPIVSTYGNTTKEVVGTMKFLAPSVVPVGGFPTGNMADLESFKWHNLKMSRFVGSDMLPLLLLVSGGCVVFCYHFWIELYASLPNKTN
jgi:hypothetical protein